MNKKTARSIVGWTLGLAMTIGVGVAAGVSSKKAAPVEAATSDIDLTTVTCDANPTDDLMSWTTPYFTIQVAKNGGTKVTNYYPGSNQSYTHTRWYNKNLLTVTPASGYQIDLFTISCMGTGTTYTKFEANTNGNCTVSTGNATVTATPTVKTSPFSLKGNDTGRYTAFHVTYSEVPTNPSVVISSKPAYLVDGGSSGTLKATITNDDSYTVTWSASPSTGVTFSSNTSTNNEEITVSFDGTTSGITPIVITATLNDDDTTESDPINIYSLEHAGTSSDPFTATEAQVFNGASYANQTGGDWYVEGYIVGEYYNTNSVLKGYYIDESPTATSSHKFELYSFTNETGKPIIVADGTNTPSYVIAHGPMGNFAAQAEFSSCTITSVDNGSVPSVVISEGDQSIFVGDPLTYHATTENPADAVVTWTSSDTDVATIGENTGVVTALTGGTTTITATITVDAKTYTDTATLTVTAPLLSAGDSIRIFGTNAPTSYYLTTVESGNAYGSYSTTQSEGYVYTVEAGSASNSYAFKNGGKYLSWSSGNSLDLASDKSQATSWYVTGDSLSDCTITAVADNTRILRCNYSANRFAAYTSATGVVAHIEKVVVANPTTLTLSTKTLTLDAEQEAAEPLAFTTDSPSAAFEWYSEDTSKATVANGVVTAGTQTDVSVKIYVYFDSDDSGDFDPAKDLNDYCTVTVSAPSIDYSAITYGGTGSKITADNKSTLLADGKKIIMTYNDSEVAGAFGNYIDASTASVTFNTTQSTVTVGDGTAQINSLTILELEESTHGFYLKTKDGKYLSNTSGDSSAGNFSKTDSPATEWVVSESGIYDYSNQANATILVNTTTTPHRFKPYKTTFSNGAAVVVYSFNEYTDEAKDYADLFLDSGLCGANNTTKASSSVWLELEDTFENDLSAGAQNVLKVATANKDSSDSIQKCLAKYDRVIYLHYGSEPLAYPDFMNRVSGGYVTPKSPANITIGGADATGTSSAALAVIGAAGAAGAAGFFLFQRKRKEF